MMEIPSRVWALLLESEILCSHYGLKVEADVIADATKHAPISREHLAIHQALVLIGWGNLDQARQLLLGLTSEHAQLAQELLTHAEVIMQSVKAAYHGLH